MAVTNDITNKQIRALRMEAFEAGDYLLGVACDLALEGSINLDDYTVLERHEEQRLAGMTQEQARELCAEAILEAEAAGWEA